MPLPSQGHYVFTVFRLFTDFVCLYTYAFLLSLCKIVRSSVILLLPLCIEEFNTLTITPPMRLPQYVIGTRINGCKIDTHTHYIIYASINLSITAIIVRTD